MKRYYLLVLVALILGAMASDTSAKTPRKRHANARTTQTRSAAKLAEKLFEIDVQPTIESQLESQAKITQLLTDYGGKTGVNGAIKALKRHAEKISSGSTLNMIESIYIDATIHHYQSTTLFKKMRENSAINAAMDSEMLSWLKLKDILQDIIAQQAYVETWGGSAARTASASGFCQLEEQRHADIKHLAALKPVNEKKETPDGFDALAQLMARNIKDNMPAFDNEALEYDGDNYSSTYKDLSDNVAQITQYIQTWIEARKQLSACFDNPADVYYATDSFVKALCEITKGGY